MPRPTSPWFTRLVRLARLAFPASSRARIRRLIIEWFDFTWITPTGVHLRVQHYGDWIIYNEIFVSGEYDGALAIAFDGRQDAGSAVHVVDLGGNVGYFTLRAVDYLRGLTPAPRAFGITAVEGNDWCLRDFRARVFDENGLADHVRLVPGLAGKRAGSATLYGDSVFGRDGSAGATVPYVDLSTLLAGVPRIDLLKCDIEGAELMVIENYPDVFQKVQVAVFELHANLCDVERCKALLRDYGLTHEATLRAGEPYFTYAVWR